MMQQEQATTDDSPAHSPAFSEHAAPALRPKRDKFIGFVRDEASAALLHEAMDIAFADGNHFHMVDFRASLAILASMTTPEVVLVDVSGEEQPLNAMMDLAEVVEAGTTVLAIGETQNVNFYRTITKGMGVREYLPKPLTKSAVERNFLSLLQTADAAGAARGGKMVAITGTRGGAGTSTIAANLAWIVSSEMHRHTVLLDTDLYSGTSALNLNVKHSSGLCTAMESPERIDQLLIERSTHKAGERLHVLAAVESYDRIMPYETRSAALLAEALRARYNFVIVDAGSKLQSFARDALYLATQKVMIVDPSMVAIRNLERMLNMPAGPRQSPRVLMVLNQAGRPGGLSQAYMEQTLGLRFDAVIPDLPRIVPKSTRDGNPAAALKGPFRAAIMQLATALGASAAAVPETRQRVLA
jgi:pilus assembly protein CpaE